MTAPLDYLTPEAQDRQLSRFIEAAAKEGLRPSGVNAEGFNCAETVPPGIMARIEAARAAIARAAA